MPGQNVTCRQYDRNAAGFTLETLLRPSSWPDYNDHPTNPHGIGGQKAASPLQGAPVVPWITPFRNPTFGNPNLGNCLGRVSRKVGLPNRCSNTRSLGPNHSVVYRTYQPEGSQE